MDKRYRVIDANINRAKEGLRVVEDICRFVLDDAALTDSIKNIRHSLTKLIDAPDWVLVRARGSDADVARQRPVPGRKSVRRACTANMKRAQEAVRVLEEFCAGSSAIKDQRYALYDLEPAIYKKIRRVRPFEDDVYVVSDDVGTLKQAALDGAAIIQLRDKTSAPEVIYSKALAVAAFCKGRDCIFMLNDAPELAVKAAADGVHIGQDTDPEQVRAIVGPEMIIGRTTHNIEQGKKAEAEKRVDYISVGPVYATPTKPGRQPTGLSYIREAAAQLTMPFVAIGGIAPDNLDDVLDAGAHTVGVVRAAPRTAEFLRRIRAWKR